MTANQKSQKAVVCHGAVDLRVVSTLPFVHSAVSRNYARGELGDVDYGGWVAGEL